MKYYIAIGTETDQGYIYYKIPTNKETETEIKLNEDFVSFGGTETFKKNEVAEITKEEYDNIYSQLENGEDPGEDVKLLLAKYSR